MLKNTILNLEKNNYINVPIDLYIQLIQEYIYLKKGVIVNITYRPQDEVLFNNIIFLFFG